MRRTLAVLAVAGVALGGSAWALPQGLHQGPEPKPALATQGSVCRLIEAAAAAHGLPVEFLTRLIWRESGFRQFAVSSKGAQGIAQFMPGTAYERRLEDPFDPEQAIPASAALLRDLRARFGNLGLAAAAYNAGANRVAEWLAGQSGLPWETEAYVESITGRATTEWVALDPKVPETVEDSRRLNCLEVAAVYIRRAQPSEPDVAHAPWQPWGVQVAGNFSQAKALAAFQALQRKHSAVLDGLKPLILHKRNLSRGTRSMTYVRIPAATREAAAGICQKLLSQGGSCVVLKN